MKSMKKIIAILALVFLSTGMSYAYQADGNPNRVEESGGTVADPVRVYRLVRYALFSPNAVALSQGEVVVWDIVSDDGVTVALVDTGGQPTASNDAVAGVVVSLTIPTADVQTSGAANEVGRRNWGYIQIYGPNDDAMVTIDEGACTAPAGLRASGAAGYASCIPAAAPNVGGGATLGFVYDTVSATAEDVEIFIRAR